MPDYGLGALIKGIRAGSAARRAVPLEAEQAAESLMKRTQAAVEPQGAPPVAMRPASR